MIRSFLIFVLFLLTSVLPPANAQADDLRLTMRSDYPYIIYVRFFSKTYSNRAWPGGNDSYIFNDSQNKSIHLACETGEKICYGAFPKSRSVYWGVGEYGNKGCNNCCFTCGDYYGNPVVLY